MAKAKFLEELTSEGLEMWEMINKESNPKYNNKAKIEKEKPKDIELNLFRVEVYHLRTELRRMIKNSENVMRDCDTILSNIQDKEEYIKSDVKSVKLVHSRFIERFKRILNSEQAFDKIISVEEEPARPYEIA